MVSKKQEDAITSTRTPLEVIGVGLPRSTCSANILKVGTISCPELAGTASLRAALEILGYPCYHMFVVLEDVKRSREWQRIYAELERGNEYPGFDAMFAGYRAAVDAPAETVWKSVLRAHPNDKVSTSLSKASPLEITRSGMGRSF
jgi:hypothetical protein